MTTPTLELERRPDGWWITGHPDGDVGPYDTRAEAEDDKRGLARVERYGHRRAFWTSEPLLKVKQ